MAGRKRGFVEWAHLIEVKVSLPNSYGVPLRTVQTDSNTIVSRQEKVDDRVES